MSEGIKVVSILGEDYSIKAPDGEDSTLLKAVTLLKASLATTKQKYPTLIGDKLLVLAALNLCAEQIDMQQRHQQELDRYQEQVSATVDVIAKAIGQP
ncbi:cell division protein ZapA [Pseudomonas fluorescens]|jgi:cell division protein ZapA|uniref:Cell division protein ZapA n=1 Tax=Pseudomonas shahriarae TaxID=2745512 RepID=A0ABT5N731_9PSED|nr:MULTISPECIES: cell division protein ZapA [Pseudomonas]AYG05934.1 cell division protein ZapA [Pseudomonas fluorescens]OAE17142.1 cell division protein ZapA [Pseudomonas brenneri]MBJ2239128.1 cell division protein ZapA [Pseudomonas sp. MF6768]MBJ2250389.1 cell division protein ZapA [Pseudomonas sp. MF6784]MBJ2261166.1 cell division protein ZapA [Pseudomonas sp. MF6787]